MFQNILFPTDGSEAANAAFDKAVDWAKTYHATIHVLYVLDLYIPALDPGAAEQITRSLEESGQETLRKLEKRGEKEGITVNTIMKEEYDPSGTIIKVAEEQNADVIVIGTHGRSGLERMFLGSTTERVLRQSEIPVLAVPSIEASSEEERERSS